MNMTSWVCPITAMIGNKITGLNNGTDRAVIYLQLKKPGGASTLLKELAKPLEVTSFCTLKRVDHLYGSSISSNNNHK
jgi:hypothetical protein